MVITLAVMAPRNGVPKPCRIRLAAFLTALSAQIGYIVQESFQIKHLGAGDKHIVIETIRVTHSSTCFYRDNHLDSLDVSSEE